MPFLQELEALEVLEGLQDLAAAGLLVEQVEKEVQEEQEVKVGLVVLLASVMLSKEYGQHTRTGMIPMIARHFVDVTKAPSMIPVQTLLLVLLENVRLIELELQGNREPKEQMALKVLQDTPGRMRKQRRQERKENQARMQLHIYCDQPLKMFQVDKQI